MRWRRFDSGVCVYKPGPGNEPVDSSSHNAPTYYSSANNPTTDNPTTDNASTNDYPSTGQP